MPTIHIFSPSEIQAFQTPPFFTGQERKRYFRISKPIKRVLGKLRTPHSQIGLLLHLGYFKKTNRFFTAQAFHDIDVRYLKGLLNVPPDTDMGLYNRKSFNRHKKIILEVSGHLSFDMLKDDFHAHIRHLVSHRIQPKEIIFQMQYWCRIQKVEMCGYDSISRSITKEINDFEGKILRNLATELTTEDKEVLDGLIVDPLLEQLYPFNNIKKVINDSTFKKIRSGMVNFLKIKGHYLRLLPIIRALELPDDTFRSYGTWLSKAKKFQVIRLSDPYLRYLHLISFIHFQFHLWQDAYVIILLKLINHYHNAAKKAYRKYQETLPLKSKKGKELPLDPLDEKELWRKTFHIMETVTLSDGEKLSGINELVIDFKNGSGRPPVTQPQETEDSPAKDIYDFLMSYQRKLTMRISPIIKNLVFDRENSDVGLINAIDTYRRYDHIIRPGIYTALFNGKEKDALTDDKNRFRPTLCKVLFYQKVADGIRSGALNLKHSYKYLAVDNYLIGMERWGREREDLIQQTGLSAYASVDNVLDKLDKKLERQYQVVHDRILNGKNQHLSFRKIEGRNRPKVVTPPLADKENTAMASLFEDTKYVMLPQILSDIQEATGFINCFQHLNIKHKRPRPAPKVFLAAMIGYGCNLGPGKMEQIAYGLDGGTVSNTLNWYFSLQNILKANDKVVSMIDKMALSDIFRKDPRMKVSSSDGQRFDVAVPSLQATYSIKYFGTGKGVSVYSFINDKYALFYNTVITASEREAPYVIDGILHNDIDRLGYLDRNGSMEKERDLDWQHSTDTHGFTEVVFGVTQLLDMTFAPRLKKYYLQNIYGFQKPGHYKRKGYFWLPKRSIDTGIIAKEWDNILRLMVSIRLKEVPASVILKRLNSYAKQNPLYRAMKEFGRIVKSIFLLRYIDDTGLRQQIQYQLNMVELSHQFAQAVFFGRSGAFQYATEEQQKIVAACRMLLQNSIVLWNYLYLSKKILRCTSEDEVKRIFKIMREGAMITWQHVHLEGTYDFKEDFLSNFPTVQVEEILDMDLKDFIDAAA